MNELIALDAYEGSVYQKWAYKFCVTNSWRVKERLGDFDDCVAQCALWWIECYRFYEGKVNSNAHLCYMFKLWVTGQFHDLSRKDYKYRCFKVEVAKEVSNSEDSDAELAVALNDASCELKEVLRIFFNSPQEVLSTLKKDLPTTHAGRFFKYVVSLYTGKTQNQIWHCIHCKTKRKWGEGLPTNKLVKELKCQNCQDTTYHEFSGMAQKDLAKELRALLGNLEKPKATKVIKQPSQPPEWKLDEIIAHFGWRLISGKYKYEGWDLE
jgi:hypothetical protein